MDVAAVTERDLRHLIWHREQMLDRRWVIEQEWQNRVRMGDLIGNGRQAMPFGKGDIRKPLAGKSLRRTTTLDFQRRQARFDHRGIGLEGGIAPSRVGRFRRRLQSLGLLQSIAQLGRYLAKTKFCDKEIAIAVSLRRNSPAMRCRQKPTKTPETELIDERPCQQTIAKRNWRRNRGSPRRHCSARRHCCRALRSRCGIVNRAHPAKPSEWLPGFSRSISSDRRRSPAVPEPISTDP